MKPRPIRVVFVCPLLFLLLFSGGCSGPEETAGAVGGVTAFAAHAPTNEIEQIYYLGVFDPREQVPAAVYRVRVHGQASALSLMKFSSGWVKADLIDSLGSDVSHGDLSVENGGRGVQITADPNWTSSLPTGRRLVLFGPEGFRTAPRGHRLVIVMGSSPESFFQALDESLGITAEATMQLRHDQLNQSLLKELLRLRGQRDRIDVACAAIEAQPAGKEGQP